MANDQILIDHTTGQNDVASDLNVLGPADWIWSGHDPDTHGQVAQFRLSFPSTIEHRTSNIE